MQYRLKIAGVMAAGWLMAWAGQAVAAETIYTDRASFEAATTGQQVTDFNNLGSGSGQPNPFVTSDFTLASPGSLLISFDPDSSPDYQFNTDIVLAVARISSSVGSFTPAAGTTAFGFDFGVRAVNAGSRVTINGVDYAATGAPTLDFFGIVSDTPLAPITFDFASSRGIFDNVTVASAAVIVPPTVGAVPEPATWLMLILGFGIVGDTLRSRRRVTAKLAA